QGLLHIPEITELRIDEYLALILRNFLQSKIYQRKLQFLKIKIALGKTEYSLPVKHKTYRARSPQGSAGFGKIMPHIRHCSVDIIGRGFYQNSNPMRSISLVNHFLVVLLLFVTCSNNSRFN